jgi:hypothetical protein
MTTILSETRERLLKAITAQVPVERIAEIHFFAPIKQGGVESGVAVIAASPEREPALVPDSEPEAPASEVAERHVIYTARYRYTLKGPDRGKWETNIVAEADAPLITVETVVRGVQRRVGDAEEPERLSGDEIRAFLETHPPQQ